MNHTKLHEMNEGAQAAIKGIRGRVSTLVRKGKLSPDAADVLRGAIKEYIYEVSQRPGGLGRK